MKRVLIVRNTDSDEGTLARVFIGFKEFYHSIELPDRNIKPNYSGINTDVSKCF